MPDREPISAHPPDARGRLRVVLTVLALAAFSFGIAEFSIMSFLPEIAREFRITEPKAGSFVSAYALGVVIGAPTLTLLASRFSRRDFLIALVAWFTVANGFSAGAQSYVWMLLARFAAGLPHGAFLGVAALVAAGQVQPERKAWAASRVFLGLAAATLAGVPFASWIGQTIGWHWGFVMVTGLSALSAVMLLLIPRDHPERSQAPTSELQSLKRLQVWLTLGIGAIGYGGMFSVYAYLASTLSGVTKASPGWTPVMFAVFGAGLTAGTVVAPLLADKAPLWSAGGVLIYSAVVLALFPLAAHSKTMIAADVFLIGCTQALGVVTQRRLMDVAGDAQILPAALNHSALNIANAIGPAAGGLAISAGLGWTATGPVGAGLAIGGLGVWAVALWLDRRSGERHNHR